MSNFATTLLHLSISAWMVKFAIMLPSFCKDLFGHKKRKWLSIVTFLYPFHSTWCRKNEGITKLFQRNEKCNLGKIQSFKWINSFQLHLHQSIENFLHCSHHHQQQSSGITSLWNILLDFFFHMFGSSYNKSNVLSSISLTSFQLKICYGIFRQHFKWFYSRF